MLLENVIVTQPVTNFPTFKEFKHSYSGDNEDRLTVQEILSFIRICSVVFELFQTDSQTVGSRKLKRLSAELLARRKKTTKTANPIGRPKNKHETICWSSIPRASQAVNKKFKELSDCTLFFISSSL
jgi:hypothetical protein